MKRCGLSLHASHPPRRVAELVIRGLVLSVLDDDIKHYLSNPINVTSIEQARHFRKTSKAWQYLCNGDTPRMGALIYR